MSMETNLKFRILLVEDDPNFADWVILAFRKSGVDHIIDNVSSGEEALNWLINMKIGYDVLIIDYILPGMNGIKLIHKLREEGIDLPIIMLSDQGSDQMVVSALSAGASDYLVKAPSTFQALPILVERAYQQKQVEKQNQELQQRIAQQNREIAETNKKLMLLSKELIKAEKKASLIFFIRGISHELNNPLAGIVGYSELLLNRVDPQDPSRDDLEEIRKCAYELKKVVSQLAKFCGREKQKLKVLDINSILKEAIGYFQLLAECRGIKIEKNFCAGEPKVEGVAVDLLLAFMAILLNARHAMPEGGEIKISTQILENSIEINIQDTGEGMSKEEQESIFTPFFSNSKRGEGRGPSLAVTYGIIRESRGEIRVNSAIGQGTTFTIILPLYEEQ